MMQKIPHVCWLALLGLAALPLGGCGAHPGDDDSSAALGTAQSEILNGTTVANADIHVHLLEPIPGTGTSGSCSGTLLTDRWVLTAKHCEMTTAGSITRGSDTRSIAQVVNHPTRDIALVQASSAFPNVYITSMYPWAPSSLVNQEVTCYGYGTSQLGGAGIGTLRSGALRVSAANSDYLTLVSANSNNQIAFFGDSGGACFLNTTSRALIGVLHGGNSGNINVAPTEDYYVPTSSFSQWALPIVAGSSERVACLGRECVTNPVPLPHNLWAEKAWRPCPDQLTGPGNYSFSFEAQYSFETNYDFLLVNGEWRTGTGTYSGTSYASHLGHQLQVVTDYSVASAGVSWLRARCPGDP